MRSEVYETRCLSNTEEFEVQQHNGESAGSHELANNVNGIEDVRLSDSEVNKTPN